jgi:cytochrome P450
MNEAALALFNPFSTEFREDPYPFYARAREAGAALPTPFGTLVTRYEDVDRLLKSPAFRTPRGYRDPDDPAGPSRFRPDGVVTKHRRLWLVFQSGEPHARLRKLITKVFTPRAVHALAPRIDALVDALLAPALERGSLEVIGDLAYPLPATVICELLGIPESDRDRHRAWSTAIAATLEVMMTDAQVDAAEKALAEWDVYLRAFLAERRARPGDALVDAMLAVEEQGARLTEDEIVAMTTFLFLAGHETTTNLVGNGLLALLRHPDELAKLHAEPKRIENAIEELLRFDSPVQFAGRVSDERVDVCGVTVEPGTNIMLCLGAANHDPRRYHEPDALDVTREDVKPLSFGGGIHFCVGAALARLESRALFSKLLGSARSIETTSPPMWRASIALRGLEALHVALR